MRVCLGSDHAGYDLKCYLTGWLKRSGYEVVDKGPFGPESVDYLARQHNDANIACLPARFISRNMARNIVKAFLTAEFEGGRHAVRVNKIPCK